MPGDATVRFECLPGSIVPRDLRAIGYDVLDDGEGERILPSAIVEKFVAGPDGEFVRLTEDSTRPQAAL